MTRIAHLSDTHFGTEVPRVAQALLDCLETLEPDLVVVSGDVTQRARAPEFAAAAAYFRQLHAPTLVLPGNHDIPLFDLASRLLRPYRNFDRTFGGRSLVWAGEGAAVLGLDTTLPSRHTRGRLDIARFERLNATLPEHPGSLRIAAVHQPLHAAWLQDRDEVLLNAQQAAAAFARGGVDVVMSGHVHVPVVCSTREAFPHLPRHFVLAGAGTAVSHRTRPSAPNSFNLLCSGDGLEVQAFHFDDAGGAFRRHASHRFRRDTDGWIEQSG